MAKKQLLIERFDSICTSMLDGQKRELTEEEEDKAVQLLLEEIYQEDREYSQKEVQDIFAEMSEEAAQITGVPAGSRKIIDDALLRKKLIH